MLGQVTPWIRASLISVFFASTSNGCATAPVASPTARVERGARLVVENYLAALNRRDTLALAAYVAPDVEWYSTIDADRVLEVSGREALARALEKYFSEHDKTRWELKRAEIVDRFVAAVERSEWSEAGHMQSQTGLGIYEIEDGRIRRITYYLNTH